VTKLILAGLLAATAAGAAHAAPLRSDADRQRYRACIALTQTNPAQAIADANSWRANGGGLPARHCIAMAYVARQEFAPAAVALEQAARGAEAERDPSAADLWGQAGNAALLANDFAKAHAYLSSAIVGSGGDPMRRAQMLIDRARAGVELGKTKEARADLDQAVGLAPKEPAAWLLRATLARRMNDLPTAASDIAQARRLAPDDADVALEAGNIAGLQGNTAEARARWQEAAKAAPGSPAAQAATKALAANPG
jgi:tetratricopeptide (TPR) repeat protein